MLSQSFLESQESVYNNKSSQTEGEVLELP